MLLPERSTYHPDHPLGCHRRRVADRIIFDKLVQVLVFGCGYRKLADAACSAITIRDRRNEWIAAGVFATLEVLVLRAYDRMIGLQLDDLAVDGCITNAPAAGMPPGAARSTATNVAASAPRWAFNTARRDDPNCPDNIRSALRWVASHTRPVSALRNPRLLRQVLDGLTVKLDGTPAAPSVTNRRRKILHAALSTPSSWSCSTRTPSRR